MKCEGEVRKKLNFATYRQCHNNATVERDGHWYCSIHDPEKVKEREEKKEAKREAKRKIKNAIFLSKYKNMSDILKGKK